MTSAREKSNETPREIGSPIHFKTTKPGGEVLMAANAMPAKPTVAVFITHGMGQQIPFETLDSAAEGLKAAAERHGNPPIGRIRTRTIQVDDLKTQRAEFNMRDARGQEVEVHVYEGYWAPITEGQLTLRDVMKFLFFAAFNGIKNAGIFGMFGKFKRWIFDRSVEYKNQKTAAKQLVFLFGLLLSLIVLNVFITIIAGDKFIHRNSTPTFSEPIFNAMTSTTGYYLLACAALGLSFYLLQRKNNIAASATQSTEKFKTILMWLILAAVAILTIVSALVLVLLAANCIPPEYIRFRCANELWWLIWGLLLGASWKVKNVLIQYMGDVAAYVDSHSLDRFDDIRTRIKARVFTHAKAVYQQPYERIAMIGHSLGSVVTYDTLNALIIQDELNPDEKLNVVERTKLLLTFGSPLDKTAFIFATQSNQTTDTREALAATLQPLIQKYEPYRNINWINVYSPQDIVSGKLSFYDDTDNDDYTAERAVKNIIDHDANIPVVAHTQYWKNPTLFDQLYNNL